MIPTYDCNIILDLLPLLAEGMTSEETSACIYAHLANCPACKQTYEEMTRALPLPSPGKTRKRRLKYRKKFRLRTLLLAYLLLLMLINAFCLIDIIFF